MRLVSVFSFKSRRSSHWPSWDHSEKLKAEEMNPPKLPHSIYSQTGEARRRLMLNLSRWSVDWCLSFRTPSKSIRFCDQIVFNPQEAQVTTDVFRSDRRWIKKLIESLRKRASLDDDFEQMLEAFVENRNILIHRALNQPWWKAKNEGPVRGGLCLPEAIAGPDRHRQAHLRSRRSRLHAKKLWRGGHRASSSRFGKVVIWMRSRIFRNSRKPPSKRRPGLRTSPERRANRKLRLGRYACSLPTDGPPVRRPPLLTVTKSRGMRERQPSLAAVLFKLLSSNSDQQPLTADPLNRVGRPIIGSHVADLVQVRTLEIRRTFTTWRIS